MFKNILDFFILPAEKYFISYILYKLFELLDYPQYLPYVITYKSKEDIYRCETSWKNICRFFKWHYYT